MKRNKKEVKRSNKNRNEKNNGRVKRK